MVPALVRAIGVNVGGGDNLGKLFEAVKFLYVAEVARRVNYSRNIVPSSQKLLPINEIYYRAPNEINTSKILDFNHTRPKRYERN